MKRLIYALILTLALAGSAGAAHLQTDPNIGQPTSYVLTGQPSPLPATVTGASIKADGSLFLDISGIANGIYPLTIQACVADPVYGGQACNAAVPFSLRRPSVTVPANTTGINIVP